MNILFSPQPLSAAFKRGAERIHGPSAFITFSDIAGKKGFYSRLRYLRSLRVSSLELAFEDANSVGFAPLMKMICAVIPAGAMSVIGPDFCVTPFGKASTLVGGYRFAKAVAGCHFAKIRGGAELRRLAMEPRISATLPNGGKIVYLHTDLWFGMKTGGSVAHVTGILKAFAESGWPVEYHSALGFTGIDPRVAICDLPRMEAFGLPMELNLLRFNKLCLTALDSIKPGDVSFVYQRMSTLNYSGVLLSRRLGVPYVLEYNGSEAWIAENWGSGRMKSHDLAVLSENANLRHAHLVVTISDVLRDELVERGVEPERIVNYPNCVDTDIFDPARFSAGEMEDTRKRLGIAPDAIVVTFVGTFGRWHGAEVLAMAVKKLAETDMGWMRARKVVFMFIGDGATAPIVRDILASSGAEDHYIMTGLSPQGTTPSYLAISDIFVSPHVKNTDGSRFFGSPTKLFEYMAMGKGIVASALEQIGDVLKPAIHVDDLSTYAPVAGEKPVAALVEPGSHEQIASAIKRLADNPSLRKTLGENARKLALSKYTWKTHVGRIMDGLRRVTLV